MKKIKRSILESKPICRFIDWSKTATPPGFSQLSLYTVFTFLLLEIKRDSILNKASSLSYNFMLAIFPSIIFLFTLIPYIPINNFQESLMGFLAIVIPSQAFHVVKSTLEDIIIKQNGGLLSIGFILATFFATNGMASLIKAFNKASLSRETKTWLQLRIKALILSFAIVVALSLGITIFTFSALIINFLKNKIDYDLSTFWTFIIKLSRWVILFGIYFFTVSMLYKYAPANSKRWKFINPGSTFATILAILTLSGFVYYINNFNTYNKLYGSIGTMIVIMIWMYLNSLILLIGFELNASILLSKKQNSQQTPKPKNHNTFKNTLRD